MNSHQRRTVRRAKDARRPYGRAVERERRKAKMARVVLASELSGGMSAAVIDAYNALPPVEWDQLAATAEKIGWRQDRFIKAMRDAFFDGANPFIVPSGVRWREIVTTPDTSDHSRDTGLCCYAVEIVAGRRVQTIQVAWSVGDEPNQKIGDARTAGEMFRRRIGATVPE